MIRRVVPKGHSPSHIDFDPIWAMAEEAGLPILFHVGGEEKLNPDYFNNGLPRVKDFHGGEENFTSVSYMPIPHAVMRHWRRSSRSGARPLPEAQVRRHRTGRVVGARLDAVHGFRRHAFTKNEERLKKLSVKPSDFVRRQVRVTPYPHEDGAGHRQFRSGSVSVLIGFPHVEGGRNPLKRFDDSLAGITPRRAVRFYSENFIDLMGEGLAADLRRPPVSVAA